MSEMSCVTSTITTATIEQASSRLMSLFAAALDQQPAEAAVVEQRLDDDDAGQQPGELQHDHGEGRDQRVPERVLQHDRRGSSRPSAARCGCTAGSSPRPSRRGSSGRCSPCRRWRWSAPAARRCRASARPRPPWSPSRRTTAARPSGWRRSPSAPRPRHTPASRWWRWRRWRAPGPAPIPRACRRGRRAAARDGIITTITQNIRIAVSHSRGQSTSATGALNRDGMAEVAAHDAAQPLAVAHQERPVEAVLVEPDLDLLLADAAAGLLLGELDQVRLEVDQAEDDQRQAERGQQHHAEALQQEDEHPWLRGSAAPAAAPGRVARAGGSGRRARCPPGGSRRSDA